MKKIPDETYLGQKFGRWTVLDVIRNGPRDTRAKFVCKCACGSVKEVLIDNAVSGKSTGCRKCSGMAGSKNPRWGGTKNVPFSFFSIMKKSASARDYDVDVTIDDIQELWDSSSGCCALSGVPITLSTKKMGCTASIDRIDSSRGYTKDNIQFVHKHVNLMKNHFDQAYFIEMCRKIAACMPAS